MSDIRKKVDYPLVEVTWCDSTSTGGWQSEPSRTPLTCWSAGYLVHRDSKSAVIALNASCGASSNAFGDTMTIPAKCITKVRRLK